MVYTIGVPHSQFSLRENPKFSQNVRSKNHMLKENFWLIFLFNICYCDLVLAFKSKNDCIALQKYVYLLRENYKTLCQKCKWALWMRHLAYYSIVGDIDTKLFVFCVLNEDRQVEQQGWKLK
jgi:hypothetical protein